MSKRWEFESLIKSAQSGHKYYVYMIGKGEGCDYTMGCNNKLYALPGETFSEALQAVSEHMGYDEYAVEDALIIEASKLVLFDVERYYADVEKKAQEADKQASEQAEKEQYERLKAKFEAKRE